MEIESKETCSQLIYKRQNSDINHY